MTAHEDSSRRYWNRRLERSTGLEGVGYLGLGRSFNLWMYRLRRHVVRRMIRDLKVSLRGKRVLDIGSGTGFYVSLWKSLGADQITASDLSETAVGRLGKNFPDVPVMQLDIGDESLATPVADFDLVSAFDVLFHIVEDDRYAQAFANIHQLLRPGGLFMFSENFVHGPTIRADHQVSRSLDQIVNLAELAGFVPLVRRPMAVLMNFPIDSRSRLWKHLWRIATAPARVHESVGWLMGASLYPLDIALTRFLREGPTTEVCVCRKPDQAEARPRAFPSRS